MKSKLDTPNKKSALVDFDLARQLLWNSIESLVNHWLRPEHRPDFF